jgi:hypothetical protein
MFGYGSWIKPRSATPLGSHPNQTPGHNTITDKTKKLRIPVINAQKTTLYKPQAVVL